MSDEIPVICGECNKETKNLITISIAFSDDNTRAYICQPCNILRQEKIKEIRDRIRIPKERREYYKQWFKNYGDSFGLNMSFLNKDEDSDDVV